MGWKCFGMRQKEQDPDCSQVDWKDLCQQLRPRRSRSRRHSKRKKKRSRSRKRRRRSPSSSSRSSSSSSSKSRGERCGSKSKSERCEEASDSSVPTKTASNPAIEKAKQEAFKKVLQLKDADIEVDERRRQWRSLLREWHPDKHEDKEVATAIFQFIQKAKSLVNV